MRNKILYLIAVVAVALGAVSCNDDNWSQGLQRTGTLSLSDLDVRVNNASRAVSDIDVSNFIVEISQNGALVGSLYEFGSMPEVLTLPVGSYQITVRSHNVQKAEWEMPYFLGTENFTVVENKINYIGTVTCYFSNVKVTILFDDDLKDKMEDDCKVTVVVNDEGSLEFTKNETRKGYFEAIAGSTTMVAIFDGTVDGNHRHMTQTYTDVTPGQHYTIKYSLKNGDPNVPDTPDPDKTGTVDPGDGTGDSGISISTWLSTDVTDDVQGEIQGEDPNEPVIIDPGKRPGEEDDPNNDPGNDPNDPNTPPTPGSEDITITSTTLSFTEPNLVVDGMSAVMDIHAEHGVAHFNVTISSDNNDFMSAVGDMLPLTFDLAYPGSYDAAFAGLGFPVANGGEYYIEAEDRYVTAQPVIDQTDLVFDISNFMGLLQIYAGTHTFTLNVVDNQNAELSKSLILKVE